MTTIYAFSDLHLDLDDDRNRFEWEWLPDADIYVFAGDIGGRLDHAIGGVAAMIPHRRPLVIVPGNHCYYCAPGTRVTMQEINASARAAAAGWGNVHLLMNDVAVIDGITFFGGTFWSDMRAHQQHDFWAAQSIARREMNDYRRIWRSRNSKLIPRDTIGFHGETYRFLSESVQRFSGPRVIVTHHSPILEAGDSFASVNHAYVSNCRPLIERLQSDAWIFGHTHNAYDETVGRTRLLSNPRGYDGEPCRESFLWAAQITLRSDVRRNGRDR